MKAVRSIERAFEMLIHFIETPIMDVTELQRRSGLPRPTLYRILSTLEQQGLVSYSGDPRQYRLTYRSLEMAKSFLSTLDVVAVSERHLLQLEAKTDETIALFVRHDKMNRILVKELVSPQPLTFTRGAGYIAPLALGAAGKAILAYLSPETIEANLAMIGSPTQRGRVRQELAKIRETNVHISLAEVIAGAVSIAAPIFQAGGIVASSIAVFGPEARLHGKHQARIAALTVQTAMSISAEMGYSVKE